MPYQFKFRWPHGEFACPLQCERCVEKNNSNGQRCKAKTCIGTPYCWQHLLHKHHLRIKPSTIPEAGKGLFAMGKAGDRAVFSRDKPIIVFDGEWINRAIKEKRYGEDDDTTAPYTIESDDGIEDAACHRGTGAIANHSRDRRSVNAKIDYDEEAKRYVLIALKNIAHDTEIFVNYGTTYRFDEPGVAHKTGRVRT